MELHFIQGVFEKGNRNTYISDAVAVIYDCFCLLIIPLYFFPKKKDPLNDKGSRMGN